ncbi:MAG TPA: TIGR02594 family protein [Pseudolabrys sp.]|nr:TIGR02594 family protein [Pseudolabrys sp.]
MCVKQKTAALALCTAISLALGSPAFAKPAHHHRHHHSRTAAAQHVATGVVIHDDRFPFLDQPQAKADRRASSRSRHQAGRAATPHAGDAYASAESFSYNPLITEARRYLGTNPTGWKSVWCGAFMDMVLRHTGHRGGGVAAKAYAHYGRRVPGPQVGAIAVMSRRGGGGHVGIVTGIDPHGNPIIISGNYNHKVVEAAFPRGVIFAYVVPN